MATGNVPFRHDSNKPHDIHYPTADEREARRQPLHLSIPPFDFGLRPTAARVRADHDLEAVSIAFDGAEVLLSPPATIAMIVRLIEAVDDLRVRS